MRHCIAAGSFAEALTAYARIGAQSDLQNNYWRLNVSRARHLPSTHVGGCACAPATLLDCWKFLIAYLYQVE